MAIPRFPVSGPPDDEEPAAPPQDELQALLRNPAEQKHLTLALRELDRDTIRRALFPNVCMLCARRACRTAVPVCSVCKPAFQNWICQPCPSCGRPASECICPHNRAVRFLFWYDQPQTHRIITSLKRHANLAHVQFLGGLLAAICNGRYDAVTYVPRRTRDIRQYGYDHTWLLARAVAKRLCIPLIQTLSCRAIIQQKFLSASQREKAMRGRFRADAAAVAAYPRLLLIDDVCTTGATLRACSRLLRKAGAESISCAALTKVRSRNRYR